jgi:SAM-dependent methyltransferase
MRKCSILAWSMALSSAALLQALAAEINQTSAKLTIAYVPTRHDVVKDLLWLAEVGKDDVVYDLGSGDGRIVIAAVRDFAARRAVGVEIDPQRVRDSREAAERAGVANRVEIVEGDLFAHDFSAASVVVLYLGHRPNIDLRGNLYRALEPGARVVAHQFGMGEWSPDKLLQVRTQHLGMFGVAQSPFADNPRTPDFGNLFERSTHSVVRVWIVPAAVAGVWWGTLATAEGQRELKLVLHQRLGEVTGSLQLGVEDKSQINLRADLWGNHLRLIGSNADRPYFESHMMFDGQVAGDTIQGKLAIFQGGEMREQPWVGKREKADFTGAWQWTSPTGSHPVQLRIERREGQFVAAYLDREQTTPVGDFYDFGGGFYFTHMVGRLPEGSVEITPDTGWLIGQAVADGDKLVGTIQFYPYPVERELFNGHDQPEARREDADARAGPRPWRPTRMDL